MIVADLHPGVPSYSELSGKVFGKTGKWVVDVSIWIMQLSCCISYLYFIAAQVDEVISDKTDYKNHSAIYILIMTVPAMIICMIETYTFLAYFSIAGILVALTGMLCIFTYCFNMIATDQAVTSPLKLFDVAGMFGHIGVAMFVFEGNAVIMNVRNETKN